MDRDEPLESPPPHDSFLDVVANVVGVLILLALAVGLRSARPDPQGSRAMAAAGVPQSNSAANDGDSPSSPSPTEAGAPADVQADAQKKLDELEQSVRTLIAARRDIADAAAQATRLRQEAEIVDARRLELTMFRAAMQKDLAERRSKLDAEDQSAYDVQVEIDQLQRKLDELTKQQLSLLDEPADVEEIQCLPTPIARTVTGDEIHVRLRGGRLAVVPVDALLDEVRSGGVDYLRNQLASSGEGSDVFGPIDGFRMRISLRVQVKDLPGASSPMTVSRKTVAQMAEFLPIRSDVGQEVEQALLPGAPLMQALRAPRANRPAVVLWCYPDSYGDIRTLKRILWEESIPLAVRPLDNGDEITFSTDGTKSQAQ